MRYVIPIIVVLLLVAALGAVKFRQISVLMDAGKAAQKAGPPPEAVSSVKADEQSWETQIPSVGTVSAAKGVEVSNESPGVVTAIRFDSGERASAGQVLVELDTSVERAQLESARARRSLADVNAGRSRVLAGQEAIAKAQLESDESTLRTSGAEVRAAEAQLNRKVVKAPFAGRLGIRGINLGQYLSPGTPIVALEAIDTVFVDFTLPQERLADVKAGTAVRVQVTEKTTLSGSITAVDPAVDATTRSLRIRASIPNPEEALRPGMFVKVSLVLPEKKSVLVVPVTALLHAPYGDSVFVLESKPDVPPGPNGQPVLVARQQFVRLGRNQGDFTAVEEGIKKGDEIATAGAFKLRNGSHVVVKNDVDVHPKLAPTPENH